MDKQIDALLKIRRQMLRSDIDKSKSSSSSVNKTAFLFLFFFFRETVLHYPCSEEEVSVKTVITKTSCFCCCPLPPSFFFLFFSFFFPRLDVTILAGVKHHITYYLFFSIFGRQSRRLKKTAFFFVSVFLFSIQQINKEGRQARFTLEIIGTALRSC